MDPTSLVFFIGICIIAISRQREKKNELKLSQTLWVFSSVGLERYLDRVEVTGSNPVTPTKLIKKKARVK